MKRNILKKNLSEDLTWADFLKNESYLGGPFGYNNITGYTRSKYSTPERKSEIPRESSLDEEHQSKNVNS